MASAHVKRLRSHFHNERRRIGVELQYTSDPDAGAYAVAWKWVDRVDDSIKGRVCLVEPISGTISYYVAMHELGHLADSIGPRGLRLRNRRPTLEREAFAWAWALDNACVPPSRGAWLLIYQNLKTYATWADEDKRLVPSVTFDRLLCHAGWSAGRSIDYEIFKATSKTA